MPDFDLAVIGAGSSGLTVTAVAAQLGLRVALIERDRMGGDCLNTGCVPSKALLAAAHARTDARAAGRFGLLPADLPVDWPAVSSHVAGVIASIAPADSEERFTGLGATVMRDEARFIDRDTLLVGGRRITARRFVVAAGSRPAIPAIPGLADQPYFTHQTLFGLPERPAHLVILGGGPIGVEMAQAHAGLGCRVSLVTNGRLLPADDPELTAIVRAALLADGVVLHEDATVAAAEPGPCLVLGDGTRVEGSHLLVATGRTPNTDGLGLESAGVMFGPRGIATDAGLRANGNPRVFAAGDIADPAGIGPLRFTHVAGWHAGVIIRRAIFRMPAKLDARAIPRVTYTTPELAQVGLTEAEARAKGHAVTVLKAGLDENDRARAERRPEGLAKLVVIGRGQVVGAGIVGVAAGEAIGAWVLAIARKVPLSAMAALVLPYPTRAEVAKRAVSSFYASRLFAPSTKRVVNWLARI